MSPAVAAVALAKRKLRLVGNIAISAEPVAVDAAPNSMQSETAFAALYLTLRFRKGSRKRATEFTDATLASALLSAGQYWKSC
jgi:hypothetical protein